MDFTLYQKALMTLGAEGFMLILLLFCAIASLAFGPVVAKFTTPWFEYCNDTGKKYLKVGPYSMKYLPYGIAFAIILWAAGFLLP